MTPDEATTLPSTKGLRWNQVFREIGDVPGETAPVEFIVLQALGYEHLGVEGEVNLSFAGGMLYHVLFYPEDFGAYIGRYRDSRGHRLVVSEAVEVGGVRVLSGYAVAESIRPGPYVSWRDISLDARFHDSP